MSRGRGAGRGGRGGKAAAGRPAPLELDDNETPAVPPSRVPPPLFPPTASMPEALQVSALDRYAIRRFRYIVTKIQRSPYHTKKSIHKVDIERYRDLFSKDPDEEQKATKLLFQSLHVLPSVIPAELISLKPPKRFPSKVRKRFQEKLESDTLVTFLEKNADKDEKDEKEEDKKEEGKEDKGEDDKEVESGEEEEDDDGDYQENHEDFEHGDDDMSEGSNNEPTFD